MEESSPIIIFIIIITLLIAQSETEHFLPLPFVYFNLTRCFQLFVFSSRNKPSAHAHDLLPNTLKVWKTPDEQVLGVLEL